MNCSLEGSCVVVTGAFGALGAAVVQAVSEAGAKVAAVDRVDAASAPKFAAAITTWPGVDLAKPAAAAAVLESIATAWGAITAVVNIAGAFRWETVADGSLDTWDLLYTVNLRTALTASKSALPHLLKSSRAGGGRIINIGAAAALHAEAGMGAYAASKSAVIRLTEALAAELKDSGITVNAILPSVIDTAANRADMPKADFERWVKPRQVADLIVFLISEKASAITGAAIPLMGRV